MSRHSSSERIARLVEQIGQQVEGYLTCDEAEFLLQISREHHYTVVNMLVRLCNEPWKIDVSLGRHGVCYYGNMGTEPDLNTAFSILYHNHHISRMQTFKGQPGSPR